MWDGLTGAGDEAAVIIKIVRRGNSSEAAQETNSYEVVFGDRRDPKEGVRVQISPIHRFIVLSFVRALEKEAMVSHPPPPSPSLLCPPGFVDDALTYSTVVFITLDYCSAAVSERDNVVPSP